jgi:hypothetical protein
MPLVAKHDNDKLLIVLDEDLIERAKNGDPFTFDLRELGFKEEIHLAIGWVDPKAEFKGKEEFLRHIFRGYKVDPSKGDGLPPVKIELGNKDKEN